jgi:hypothetical protein
MVLELLQEQYPMLQRRLQRERMMLGAVETYAHVLKTNHGTWVDRLAQSRPGADQTQIASEALELALAELREDLPSESTPSGATEEPVSLDAAMAFIRRHTPPA